MRVFRVWPKRIRRGNGIIITPDMVVTVTTRFHTPTPFAYGLTEVRDAYMRIYRCDIAKMGCSSYDFNFIALDK